MTITTRRIDVLQVRWGDVLLYQLNYSKSKAERLEYYETHDLAGTWDPDIPITWRRISDTNGWEAILPNGRLEVGRVSQGRYKGAIVLKNYRGGQQQAQVVTVETVGGGDETDCQAEVEKVYRSNVKVVAGVLACWVA